MMEAVVASKSQQHLVSMMKISGYLFIGSILVLAILLSPLLGCSLSAKVVSLLMAAGAFTFLRLYLQSRRAGKDSAFSVCLTVLSILVAMRALGAEAESSISVAEYFAMLVIFASSISALLFVFRGKMARNLAVSA